MFFCSKHKLVETYSTIGHVLRLLTFFLTLEVHEIKFFKTFSRGDHHIKWFFVRTDIFRNIFWDAFCSTKSRVEFIKNVFLFKTQLVETYSTMGHFLRLLKFFLTLQVHKIQFFKTFSRGHHHIKWFFVRTDIFRNIFWDAFCSTKSRVEFIKNVFLFKTQLVEAYSTMGHFLTLLKFFLTLQVHEIKFLKTFSRGHHHIKWFFVRTDIFRNIF